jgi:chromosome segregation ATPase
MDGHYRHQIKKKEIIMTEHRDEYLETLKAKMAELNGKIDKLQEKADQAGGEMKMQYQKSIEELRTMYAQAEEKIENLPNSPENAGESFMAAVESSYEALTEAVQRLLPE